MSEETQVEESSGNVFADLGFENPDEELAKALLSRAIERAIERAGLTQAAARPAATPWSAWRAT